jgi:cytoskeletal protein CcmA (bactofilin family)
MGFFGRDERSDASKPSSAEPQHRSGPVQATGVSVTLIAKPTRFEGAISGSGEVRIEGAFKGKLDGSSQVVVAQGGEVEAELRAEHITVAGRVRGDLFASVKIELTPSADVQGDITSPRILIREGATFEGQVFMSDTGKKKAAKPGDTAADKPADKGTDKPADAKPPAPKPDSK